MTPTADHLTIADLARAMERIAPTHLAEEWDNVGLLVGRTESALSGQVLLTIDLTDAVLEEAIGARCGAIIAYHPPIFQALKRVVGDRTGPGASMSQRVVLGAAENKIAIYSPHTALDAAAGGITDWLAGGVLGATAPTTGGDRRAIKPIAAKEPTQELKIVTFVPDASLERVRGALASSGAGIIGQYESCSFSSQGQGTFMGSAGTNPAVGKPGEFETVHERRLEMVCSRRALPLALAALRQLHPYEEPAIDVYPLEPKPMRDVGIGRRITLDHPATLKDLASRLKSHLRVPAVQVAPAAGVDPMTTPVDRVGVLPGAGGSIAPRALADQCQVFITGEMKHHEVLAMTSAGMSIILAGHTASERGYLTSLARRLQEELSGVSAIVSKADREPTQLL